MKKLDNEHGHPDGGASFDEATIFKIQQEMMLTIYENGFTDFAESRPDYLDAFDLENHKPQESMHRCLCCMDERVGVGVHVAGSGILLPEKEFMMLCEKCHPDSISSHKGCGAAKIFANSPEGKEFINRPKVKKIAKDESLNLDESDDVGKAWAIYMAKKRGIPYVYLEPEEPKHSALVCYYDGTGRFNNTPGLPKGFVVGRKYMDKKSSLAEVQVAKNIIFGDNGFGPDFFTQENPFLLVAIGDTQEQVDELKEELADMDFGNGVAIDGLVAPDSERPAEKKRLAS